MPGLCHDHDPKGITRVAAEEHADVIVLTTHGEDSFADRFHGSHAERIVRQSPCPVLVV